MASCWGFQQNPPHPPAGAVTPRGRGSPGRKRCQLSSTPATKAAQRARRNEVAPVQVPTAALVQKIHPELVAAATAMGRVPPRGGGATPEPGVPARSPGRAVGAPGALEPGAARDQRLLPRLPLPPPAFDVPGLRPW